MRLKKLKRSKCVVLPLVLKNKKMRDALKEVEATVTATAERALALRAPSA